MAEAGLQSNPQDNLRTHALSEKSNAFGGLLTVMPGLWATITVLLSFGERTEGDEHECLEAS